MAQSIRAQKGKTRNVWLLNVTSNHKVGNRLLSKRGTSGQSQKYYQTQIFCSYGKDEYITKIYQICFEQSEGIATQNSKASS